MRKFCVLVSGGGTNLQSLIDSVQRGEIQGQICGVISSRPGVYALERAEKAGIPTQVIRRKEYADAQAYDLAMRDAIKATGAEFVVLAGFLSIIGPQTLRAYPNAIINIHPALLPSFGGKGYYGLHVHEAVLNAGVKITGATVHFVDEGTDTGPIIAQGAAEVKPGDTPEVLQARVMEIEHRLLPQAVGLMAQDRLQVDGRQVYIKEEQI